MRKAATTEEYDRNWEAYEAALERLWHKARRHGWRVERTDPSILWYRGGEFVTVWFDWLSMEVEIEHGNWVNANADGGVALRKAIDRTARMSFEDFEKGSYNIKEVL